MAVKTVVELVATVPDAMLLVTDSVSVMMPLVVEAAVVVVVSELEGGMEEDTMSGCMPVEGLRR